MHLLVVTLEQMKQELEEELLVQQQLEQVLQQLEQEVA
jgi:hypothetical protein